MKLIVTVLFLLFSITALSNTDGSSTNLLKSASKVKKSINDAGFSAAFDLSYNTNIWKFGDEERPLGWTYDFSLSKTFLENYTASMRVLIDEDPKVNFEKDQVKIRSLSLLGSGGVNLRLSRKAWDIKGFKLGASMTFPIAVGREMNLRQGVQFGVIPALSLRAPKSWLTEKINITYGLRAGFVDHKFYTTTRGTRNVPYKIINTLGISYNPIERITLSATGVHAAGWSYYSNVNAIYLFSGLASLKLNDSFSVYANYINAGDVLSPDGDSYEVEVHNKNEAVIYLGATVTL